MASRLLRPLVLLVLALLAVAGPARGQSAETFEIGLSTNRIAITSDFNGARLVVFGAVDSPNGPIMRQGGYDIIVALQGPRRPVVVRKKERVLGLWVNRGSESFETAPISYALASTRRLFDIARPAILAQLSVGVDQLRLGFDRGQWAAPERGDYAEALRRIKTRAGLYSQTVGTIEFVSPTLFRANLHLPADLPVGRHLARAFLFHNGVFVREQSETLEVVKSGFENYIFEFATQHGLLYGFLAVGIAIFSGWFGRLIFRRD